MTVAELIEQHLGPNWWEREHDGTALAALLDRVMEEEDCKPVEAFIRIEDATAWTVHRLRPYADYRHYKDFIRLLLPVYLETP